MRGSEQGSGDSKSGLCVVLQGEVGYKYENWILGYRMPGSSHGGGPEIYQAGLQGLACELGLGEDLWS